MAFRNGRWERGTTNGNSRGSSYTRRARKLWLIETYGWPDPVDPLQGIVLCWQCSVPMTFEDITVDRYPLAGIDGGGYGHDNIRPACRYCNEGDGCTRRRGQSAALKETATRGCPTRR
jgi:hypothetical protein